MTAQRATADGWARIDPRPWRSKCSARWKHPSGWTLDHCGHPTAVWPWALYNPSGEMVGTGVLGPHRRADFGTAWRTLEEAFAYVATVLEEQSA